MNVLLIDHYDSFTFNLFQYLSELTPLVAVARYTEIPFERVERGEFTHIVLSPGPGNPTDPAYFGPTTQLIKSYYRKLPMLGICLGHQGIAAALGARIVKAPTIMHGKTSTFTHSSEGLFAGLPNPISVMRYHSLVVDKAGLPQELAVDAVAEDGSIMAFHHRRLPVYGIQFHPESFETEVGKTLLKNFLTSGGGVT